MLTFLHMRQLLADPFGSKRTTVSYKESERDPLWVVLQTVLKIGLPTFLGWHEPCLYDWLSIRIAFLGADGLFAPTPGWECVTEEQMQRRSGNAGI